MNEKAPNNEDAERQERELVKTYMQLMGASEAGARDVFMYTCDGEETASSADSLDGEARPAPRRMTGVSLLVAVVALVAGLAQPVLGQSTSSGATPFLNTPLALADAVNLALSQNPSVLRARKDLEATEGLVIQTRAIAIPRVVINGGFKAVEPSNVDTLPLAQLGLGGRIPAGLTFSMDKSWTTQIQLVQSLYEGGRILSALRTARLLRQQSYLNYLTALADVVLAVQVAYFDVLLAQQQIVVQEASVELLTKELTDMTRRYDAGTVPRFNVLRAEVEVANARPKLIRARNSFRIAKNNLANQLGFDFPKTALEDIPLTLSGKLEATPYQVELAEAIHSALATRTELAALQKTQALRREDLVTAKAGYKPNLQAFAGYGAQNSAFHEDLSYEVHGWVTGVQLNWNIFDGLATRGKVRQANAMLDRAQIDLDDIGRRIELEVRTAYSNFIEAREVNESEKKVIEEAEEALRLARSRFEAGTGTQLDVLSAQTALTDARTTAIEALHDYAVARARLERASGTILPAAPTDTAAPGK